MITEEYLKEHFVTASFIDSERQNIEILITLVCNKKTQMRTMCGKQIDIFLKNLRK